MERSLEVVIGIRSRSQSNAAHDEPVRIRDRHMSSSFCGIDKGYRFFKDGHVQAIEYHDL